MTLVYLSSLYFTNLLLVNHEGTVSLTRICQSNPTVVPALALILFPQHLFTEIPMNQITHLLVLHQQHQQQLMTSITVLQSTSAALWKHCRKGHQSAFRGKEDKPSIALEATCDYIFWNVSLATRVR